MGNTGKSGIDGGVGEDQRAATVLLQFAAVFACRSGTRRFCAELCGVDVRGSY